MSFFFINIVGYTQPAFSRPFVFINIVGYTFIFDDINLGPAGGGYYICNMAPPRRQSQERDSIHHAAVVS